MYKVSNISTKTGFLINGLLYKTKENALISECLEVVEHPVIWCDSVKVLYNDEDGRYYDASLNVVELSFSVCRCACDDKPEHRSLIFDDGYGDYERYEEALDEVKSRLAGVTSEMDKFEKWAIVINELGKVIDVKI